MSGEILSENNKENNKKGKIRKIYSSFITLAIFSIIITIITLFLTPSEIISKKYDENIGYFIGSCIGITFFIFVYPIALSGLIIFISNLFRKKKKKLSFLIIWVIFFIFSSSEINDSIRIREKFISQKQAILEGCKHSYRNNIDTDGGERSTAFCEKYSGFLAACLASGVKQDVCLKQVLRKIL